MSALPDPLHAALSLVARRPLLPLAHMALMLKQEHAELQIRLDAARRLGWLSTERACCGRENRYAVTEAGCSTLESWVAWQVDGTAAGVSFEAR